MIKMCLLGTNPYVDLVHRAGRICVGLDVLKDEERRLEYIGKVAAKGHESILEHSNLIIYVSLLKEDLIDFLNVAESMKYLNYRFKEFEGSYHIIIGGSIRGYKHIFNNVENLDNKFIRELKNLLTEQSFHPFFMDLISAGVMDMKDFHNKSSYGLEQVIPDNGGDENSKIVVLNIDKMDEVHKAIIEYIAPFSKEDLLDILTVSVIFQNISRTASHQLVRHRNAISQESQRYVDYSNKAFIDPRIYKDKYKDSVDTTVFDIHFLNEEYRTDLQTLGDEYIAIYEQLRGQGLDNEDARAFLPSNVETKVMMTFTYRNLIKFLQLRTEPGAQGEIRSAAVELEEIFSDAVEEYIGNIYKYLIPKFMLSEAKYDYDNVDEILDELFEDEKEEEEEEEEERK